MFEHLSEEMEIHTRECCVFWSGLYPSLGSAVKLHISHSVCGADEYCNLRYELVITAITSSNTFEFVIVRDPRGIAFRDRAKLVN